jgi:hypothetical protein
VLKKPPEQANVQKKENKAGDNQGAARNLHLKLGMEVDDKTHQESRQKIGQRKLFVAHPFEVTGIPDRFDDVIRSGNQEKIKEEKDGGDFLPGLYINDPGKEIMKAIFRHGMILI